MLETTLLHLVTERPHTPTELAQTTQTAYKLLLPALEQLRSAGLLCRRMTDRGAIWALRRLPETRSVRVESYAVIQAGQARPSGSWWLCGAAPEDRSTFQRVAQERTVEREGVIRKGQPR